MEKQSTFQADIQDNRCCLRLYAGSRDHGASVFAHRIGSFRPHGKIQDPKGPDEGISWTGRKHLNWVIDTLRMDIIDDEQERTRR